MTSLTVVDTGAPAYARPVAGALDDAIDIALDRLRVRAGESGGGFGLLGEAIARAGAGGKRFRPELVLRSFSAFADAADPPAGVFSVAVAFELLHTAFVVHDDVIDRDTMRRGIPNVAGEFRTRGRALGASPAGARRLGDTAAILAGDLLLHEAVRLVALAEVDGSTRERLLALLENAVLVSAIGELADVENAVSPAVGAVETLLATAHDKTAVYSFTAPLQAGALMGGAGEAQLAALARAGAALGLAFQLTDDLIGAFGSPAQAGREAGADLREAKRTPLIAYAHATDTWPHVRETLALARTGPVAVRAAQRAVEASGARVRLLGVIDSALADARDAGRDTALPAPAAELIAELADRVEARIP